MRRRMARLLTRHRCQEWLLNTRELNLRHGSDAIARPTPAQGAVDASQHFPVILGQKLRQLADRPVPLRSAIAAAIPGGVGQRPQQGCRALAHPAEFRHGDQMGGQSDRPQFARAKVQHEGPGRGRDLSQSRWRS